ncbi:hypothetical protein ACHAXS_000765, partial [Conticribra weissflogii]
MKPKAPSHLLSTLTALFCTTTFLNAQTPPPCPSTLNNFVLLDQSTVFYYALLPSTAADGETPNGILCGRVEHDGESWIALAVAETADEMVGAEAIIGLPDDNSVLKYDMTGKSADLVTPMGESMQTLWDESIVQENGKTIMTFTKWLVEENELEISEGMNNFMFAIGSSNSLAYHAIRSGVGVNLVAESVGSSVTNDTNDSGAENTSVNGNREPCTVDFCENILKNTYLLRYKINIPDGQTVNSCEGCSITMELTYEGEAWIAIAFTKTREMVGSEAVIGIPGSIPLKYSLGGYSTSLVTPMPDEQQTLIDASVTSNENAQTIMTFTKLMSEPGEIEIVYGNNLFLWAHGSGIDLAYH